MCAVAGMGRCDRASLAGRLIVESVGRGPGWFGGSVGVCGEGAKRAGESVECGGVGIVRGGLGGAWSD